MAETKLMVWKISPFITASLLRTYISTDLTQTHFTPQLIWGFKNAQQVFIHLSLSEYKQPPSSTQHSIRGLLHKNQLTCTYNVFILHVIKLIYSSINVTFLEKNLPIYIILHISPRVPLVYQMINLGLIIIRLPHNGLIIWPVSSTDHPQNCKVHPNTTPRMHSDK